MLADDLTLALLPGWIINSVIPNQLFKTCPFSSLKSETDRSIVCCPAWINLEGRPCGGFSLCVTPPRIYTDLNRNGVARACSLNAKSEFTIKRCLPSWIYKLACCEKPMMTVFFIEGVPILQTTGKIINESVTHFSWLNSGLFELGGIHRAGNA